MKKLFFILILLVMVGIVADDYNWAVYVDAGELGMKFISVVERARYVDNTLFYFLVFNEGYEYAIALGEMHIKKIRGFIKKYNDWIDIAKKNSIDNITKTIGTLNVLYFYGVDKLDYTGVLIMDFKFISYKGKYGLIIDFSSDNGIAVPYRWVFIKETFIINKMVSEEVLGKCKESAEADRKQRELLK